MRRIIFILCVSVVPLLIFQSSVVVNYSKCHVQETPNQQTSIRCSKCGGTMSLVKSYERKTPGTGDVVGYMCLFKCGKCNHIETITSSEPCSGVGASAENKEVSLIKSKGTLESTLKPGDTVKINEHLSVVLTKIANGCGSDSGLGKIGGQIGAGVDAALNSQDPVLRRKAQDAVQTFHLRPDLFALQDLLNVSIEGMINNPNEFKRLNEEACAAHDTCYVFNKDKKYCDDRLAQDGASFSAGYTVSFGQSFYEKAQKEGQISRAIQSALEKRYGKKVNVPAGYMLSLINK